MIHDPLCMNSHFSRRECNCNLIKSVRADEREKVVDQINNIPAYRRIKLDDGSWLGLIRKEDAATVARGKPKSLWDIFAEDDATP